jgi:hypothetical protein
MKAILLLAFFLFPSLANAALPTVENSLNQSVLTMWMKRAHYDPAGKTFQDTLYTKNAQLDTTMVYRTWPFTGMQVVTTNPADSSKVKWVLLVGFANDSVFSMARVDSGNVTTVGVQLPTALSIPVAAGYFAIEFSGTTGNGNRGYTRALLGRQGGAK